MVVIKETFVKIRKDRKCEAYEELLQYIDPDYITNAFDPLEKLVFLGMANNKGIINKGQTCLKLFIRSEYNGESFVYNKYVDPFIYDILTRYKLNTTKFSQL